MRRALWAVLMVVMLAGCGADVPLDEAALGTPTPSATPTPTAIPTIESTAETPKKLTLWLPDVLLPSSANEDTPDLLGDQIAAFSASEDGVTVDVRRKRLRDAGGIMQTLRTAREVAPGIVPDLTLIRREDLLTAVAEGLVEPMEGLVSTAVIGELYPNALELGQVNNTLYGLPYTLEVQHMIFADGAVLDGAQLAAYVDDSTPFVFPATRANGLNSVLLVQYLSAGNMTPSGGELVLDEAVLESLLTVYEDMVNSGAVSPNVLNYTRPLEYRSLLTGESFAGGAVVNSSLYLELMNAGDTFEVAPIPTLQGNAVTTLDGWIWVMTSVDPNQQVHVSNFLSWMMDISRQGEYASMMNLLPSQQMAMRGWYPAAYDAFITQVMEQVVLPYGETANGVVARAIQSAFVTVINGERTASQAVQDVAAQITN